MCETGSNGVNKEESEEENRAERTNLKKDADETNPTDVEKYLPGERMLKYTWKRNFEEINFEETNFEESNFEEDNLEEDKFEERKHMEEQESLVCNPSVRGSC